MKLLFVTGFVLLANAASSQIVDRKKEEVKNKSEQRVENKSSEAIDKGLDKIEKGIGNIFKKKDKKKKGTTAETETRDTVEQKQNGTNTGNSGTTPEPLPTRVSTTSSYDFVPGAQVLYSTDFSRDAIGDFPVDFNTNASGEVVTISGKQGKWLSLNKNGAFIPEGIKTLPENFTLEFEIGIQGDPSNNYSGFGINFTTVKEELMKDVMFGLGTSVLWMHPAAAEAYIGIFPSSGDAFVENSIKMSQWNVSNKTFAKISIWRQKGRIRLYVNQEKVVDVPRFFVEKTPYELAFFRQFFGDCEVFLTNVRFAIAGTDTRSKLIEEGRFVTNEILFDVNSDVIKSESTAALKDIGNILRDNPSVNILIVGHTDSDGDGAANLELSKKRAQSVKNKLVNEFRIEAMRIKTDGKGESQPVESNTTVAGKAKNRRVEFIKQ